MGSMDEILRRSLLFDFYGELLTDHQKEIFEAFNNEDLSLGEIASQTGISRQGVHDLVKRASASLEAYEAKLHLVERFLTMQEQVEQIRTLAVQMHEEHAETRSVSDQIVALSEQLLEEL